MDLFAPPQLTREAFTSRRLSIVPMRGDAMMPTLRGEWDYVLAAPCDRFTYDTLYVLEDEEGVVLIYRCHSAGNGQIRILRDNKVYDHCQDTVDREWFNQHVVGIVVCDLKVRDAEMLRAAWASGK